MSRSNRKNKSLNTFGATYDEYDKTVASHGLQHWQGRGPSCNLGNDGSDLDLVKKKGQTFAQPKDDRGLKFIGPIKQQKTSKQPGPTDYVTMDPTSI